MNFTKMHGAGNDYVYVNGFVEERDWAKIAVPVSDRHTGVGADGVIVAMKSDKADFKMRMFNADGSEGEMCGNGIRCLVAFARDNHIISSDQNVVSVETAAGVLKVESIVCDGIMSGAIVDMGKPIFAPVDVPVNLPETFHQAVPTLNFPLDVSGQEHSLSFVSMGNPHAISFLNDDVDDFPLTIIGPEVENHEMFPNRINFEIVNVVDEENLKVRVWERGSGITMACGTGACAVAVAAQLKGLVGEKVNVHLPGGKLIINWKKGAEVMMEGPIETVFSGVWLDKDNDD
ncbi:MAG: diaminopimelate epimerase [Chloroflexi bacterium]|nr:diaminopimelate epimerase [Chloroflexota bacterium]